MPAPPAIGSIRLHDKVVPDLAAGDYRVSATLDITEGSETLPRPAEQHTHLRLMAPRFALAPDEVVESYPPPAAAGPFGLNLPHVTLGRRTLPWERKMQASHALGQYPWMALLIVAEDEGKILTGPIKSLLPAAVVTRLQNREAIVDDPPISVLELNSAAIMRALLPTRDETALLAHVRQVNMADTALAGADDDGWFAIITANRLPPPAADQTDKPYLACLVSLEERSDVFALSRAATAVPPLVLLHSWPFTVSAKAGTFGQLAASLDVAPFGGGAAEAELVDEYGRIPVVHTDYEGVDAVARYRGPLLGLTAAAAPAGGEPDISLKAATEIGRLLGIADGRALRDLVEWHRRAEAEIRAALEQEQLALPTVLGGMATLSAVQDMIVRNLQTSHLAIADIGRLTLTEIDP